MAAVAVVIGAGFGGLLRWLLALAFQSGQGALPWGTLVANLLGGLLIGMGLHVLGDANPLGLDPARAAQMRLLCITGFLGGLTTFSTFSSEVVAYLMDGRWGLAALWALIHLLGSLALTALGLALSRWWIPASTIS